VICSLEILCATKEEKDDGEFSYLPRYLLQRWEPARHLRARDWRARLANTARLFTRKFLSLELLVGGEYQPLPEQVADLFDLEGEVGVTLHIDREHLEINCHFFVREEIEFDLNPKDFKMNSRCLACLISFVRLVDCWNKAVVLTPENCADIPLFRFDPETNEETWFLEQSDSR